MGRCRRRRSLAVAMLAVAMLAVSAPLTAQGATAFASPAFQGQWSSVEGTIPNFWGPLDTARDGQAEPYAEGRDNGRTGIEGRVGVRTGLRLVQYFDKARMELTTPEGVVTNGLLTVELKSGQMQFGNDRFQQLAPANIGIAGDEGAPGPTYAALAQLPERVPQAAGAVDRSYDAATGTFVPLGGDHAAPSPETTFAAYLADPGGRYGQNVPQVFADYLARIPGGWVGAMGYPIAPAFAATVRVGGRATFVVAQAFERRVLTYTPTNPAEARVEMGNIGRHYYQWRYSGVRPIPSVVPATLSVPASVAADRLPAGFGALYNGDERVRARLGPLGGTLQGPGAWLPFERGYLLYSGDPDTGRGTVYPLIGDLQSGETGGYSRGLGFGVEADPTRPGGGPGPQPGLYEPKGGFFVFWNLFAAGRDRLGYATAAEATRFPLTAVGFQRGVMLSTPDGQGVYVLWRGSGAGDRYERFALPVP